MSVINTPVTIVPEEHTDTSIKGILLLVLNFLEDVCLLFFVAFPFFLREGGSVHRLVFCVQVVDRLQRRDQSNKKWLLQLAGLFYTIPHCLITWKQLARNNYVSKGLFFLEVTLLFDPLSIFHG